jgi:hypothetical protein
MTYCVQFKLVIFSRPFWIRIGMTWEEQACILGILKQDKSDYFHAKKEINTLS